MVPEGYPEIKCKRYGRVLSLGMLAQNLERKVSLCTVRFIWGWDERHACRLPLPLHIQYPILADVLR